MQIRIGAGCRCRRLFLRISLIIMYDNLVISYVFSKHGMHITFPFFSRLRDPMNFSPQTEQRSEP